MIPESRALSPQLDYGKLPPQALDLEEAVLGAMLLEKDAVPAAIFILAPDMLYKDTNQKIMGAMQVLHSKGEPVDTLTVIEQLRSLGSLEEVGGPFHVADLTKRIVSGANVEHYAMIVKQKYLLRELIKISSQAIQQAYDDTSDVWEVLEEAQVGLSSISRHGSSSKPVGAIELSKQFKERLEIMKEARDKSGEGVTGVPTGLHYLDILTSGWQKSDLVIVAARPGMGKTSFTKICITSSIDAGIPVAMFSLEMSSFQVIGRLASEKYKINNTKIVKGKLSSAEILTVSDVGDGLSNNGKSMLFVDDGSGLTAMQFRMKARDLVQNEGVGLIIIDYLQLMKGSGKGGKFNREQEISEISREIKAAAKELDIPIIALSQLSRTVETRDKEKKPMLSDLRESGAIEQDADMVLFLYRPEYYNIPTVKLATFEGVPVYDSKGLGKVILAKHRNGALDEIWVRFIGKFTKFADLYYNGAGQMLDAPEAEDLFTAISNSEPVDDETLPF